jgi:ketosteroid isomerase-like protein
MSTEELIDRFVHALEELERFNNTKPLVALFAVDAVLLSPVYTDGIKGPEGIERFWQEYRHTFSDIASHFRRKLVCNNVATLEWSSEGHLAGNRGTARYAGVSIFEHDGQKIRKFNTYYDTAQLFPRPRVSQK